MKSVVAAAGLASASATVFLSEKFGESLNFAQGTDAGAYFMLFPARYAAAIVFKHVDIIVFSVVV